VTRRQRISRPRRTDSFRRTPGNKPPRSITLIICEGETEQTYFNAARIRYGLTTAEVVGRPRRQHSRIGTHQRRSMRGSEEQRAGRIWRNFLRVR